MHVNELAREAGVPAHVVGYYKQVNLLHPKREPNSRYRDYMAKTPAFVPSREANRTAGGLT